MQRVRELQAKQGWTESGMGDLAIEFIQQSALVDEFLCKLEELADMENLPWSVSLRDSGDLVKGDFASEADANTWLEKLHGGNIDGYVVEKASD